MLTIKKEREKEKNENPDTWIRVSLTQMQLSILERLNVWLWHSKVQL